MSMMLRTITSYSSPINRALSALVGVPVTDGAFCELSEDLVGAVV